LCDRPTGRIALDVGVIGLTNGPKRLGKGLGKVL